MVLMSGKTVVGELNPSVTKGMDRTEQIEMLDSCTFKITCQYTALEDMETARINLDFVHKSASDYWMIPSLTTETTGDGEKNPKVHSKTGNGELIPTAAHLFPEQPTRKEHGLPLPCGATSPRMKKRVSPVP